MALEPVTYTLASPITTHAGSTTTLTLKPPKGRSFLKGIPFKIEETANDDGTLSYQTHFNPKVCFDFLADMTGLNTIDLEDIAGEDMLPLFRIVMDFTLGRPPKSKT